MNLTKVINLVSAQDLVILRKSLEEEGYYVLEIDGQNVADGESFFKAAAEVLPANPPLKGATGENWDAFEDSVWEGFSNLGKSKVVVIWTHADKILESGLGDLISICDCFFTLSRQLKDTKSGIEKPIEVKWILAGEGPNFSKV